MEITRLVITGSLQTGTRTTAPAPPASVTHSRGSGTQHGQAQGLLPNKASELPVPKTCDSTGRVGQKMVVEDSLLQGWGLLLLTQSTSREHLLHAEGLDPGHHG